MRNILSILLLLVIANTINAQGINFEHGTFKEALAKAQSENKMVFMDCFTTWCGPCKKMSQEVFPQKEVGDYINANFISIKVDMEKGEGIELAKKYEVNAFPTLLFLDATGKVVHKKIGGADVNGFLKEAQIAKDPSKQLPALKEKYNAGNRDIEFVSQYVEALCGAFENEEEHRVGKLFISKMPIEQSISEHGFKIIQHVGIDYKSVLYNYYLANAEKIKASEKIGKTGYEKVIGDAINSFISDMIKTSKSIEELNSVIDETKKDFVSPYQKMMENNWLNEFYLANQQFVIWFDSNIKQAVAQTDNRMKQSILINTCYKVATDPVFEPNNDICKKAINTIEQLKAENEDLLASYYCLATLYKKVGNKESALTNINGYIKISTEQGKESDKRTIDLKSEIENM